MTQCIYVAAKLGIADLLKDGPRTSEDLAQATGTHAPSLYRVLRLLTAVDLLTEEEAHSFALTPLGTYLQTGVPGSMRTTALVYGDTAFLARLGGLAPQRRNGRASLSACLRVLHILTIMRSTPKHAALFDQMMTELTASVAPTVAAAYDFSATPTLVDVGGGHGQMLASILQAHLDPPRRVV